MENKNSNKGLIILIIILILMVLGLGSYIVYDKFINVSRKSESNKVENKKATKEDRINKKDNTKAIVYTEGNYEYKKVPVINIDSIDADRLNKEINDYLEEMKKNTDYGEGYNLSYDYYENDNILSIKITINTFGASKYYKTFNISTKTGKEVTNKEILNLKNIEESDFSSKLLSAYEKEQSDNDNLDAVKTQHIYGDEYTSVYDGTKMNIENTKIEDFDMYLNKNKELCVVADVYLLAGPERNFYIYNLDTNSREK